MRRAKRDGNGRRVAAAAVVAALVLAACSNAKQTVSTGSNAAPGVTANKIVVGSLSTQSGPIAADFAPIVPGVQAYFDMVNAAGGVDGRKIDLAYNLDDASNPTTNAADARTLVEQDHVFAVVGVATFSFTGATYLAQTGTPTFGYVTSNDWSPYPNLFGSFGSYLDYSTSEPFFAYAAKKVGAKSAAVIAYNVPASADECKAAAAGFAKFGIHVGFEDLAAGLEGTNITPEVLRMKQAGVDFVVSCMDVTGNIALARTMQQNGMTGIHQIWLDGYDRSVLAQYPQLMANTMFLVQHVPYEAATEFRGAFPALTTYLQEMKRYEPAYAYNEVAFDGWISAALFVQGLRAAGHDLTQGKLVAAINKMTDFTGGGLTQPISWKTAHSQVTSPTCNTFVEATPTGFKTVFNHGTHLYVCFKNNGGLAPVAAPPGTPGG